MSHQRDNFRYLTQTRFEEFQRRKTNNIHYVCNALQREVNESMGPTNEWLNVDVLQFIDTAYHSYCRHSFYPSTLCNLMVDWSIQHEYAEKDALYIGFTEYLLETHPIPPEEWGFFLGEKWVHPFGNRFMIEKAISHYLSAIDMTPVSYINKYPNTALQRHLVYQIGENV